MPNEAAIDTLAALALDAYYRDASVHAADRNDDDAAWLLAGTYDEASERLDAHENNTGDECPNWRAAVMDYFLLRDGAPQGMTATDHAAAILDIFDSVGDADVRAACIRIADDERDTWHAIAHRADASGDDAVAHVAWCDAVGDMENNLS